jgi:hypothetical protein
MLGFCCALPALQSVLLATVSLSLLGRNGSNMYCDRLVELINKLQQGTKRSSSAASFQRAIDLTTLLRPMLHVRHAFQAAEQGAAETDDPVTASMLVQARVLQDAFLCHLGRDLTQRAPQNPFWHSGNAVTLTAGDFKEYQPWEWLERSADGRSAGRLTRPSKGGAMGSICASLCVWALLPFLSKLLSFKLSKLLLFN